MKETAENRTEARPQPGPEDDVYTGLARHPLARKWLRRSLKDQLQKAAKAGPGAEREKRHRIAEGIRAQLKVSQ